MKITWIFILVHHFGVWDDEDHEDLHCFLCNKAEDGVVNGGFGGLLGLLRKKREKSERKRKRENEGKREKGWESMRPLMATR